MSGVKFGDNHTGDDWGFFCTDIEIDMPEVQRYQIDVPGRQGKLDITDVVFDGIPRYYNRTGKFEFTAPGLTPQEWHDLISEISGKLHGQIVSIILDEDPDWYYTGSIEIDSDEDDGEVTIEADMEPFKLAVSETVYEVTESGTIALTNDRMQVVPTVTVTDETQIKIGTSSISMSAGTYELTGYPLSEGTTEWTIETSGTVTITYRQGRL